MSDGPDLRDSRAPLGRARALLEMGRPALAEEILAGVVASEPANGQALCLLAQAQYQQRHFAESERTAAAACTASPALEWPFRIRALALSELGRPGPAIRTAQIATRLAPDNDVTVRVLSDCLRRGGYHAAARDAAAHATQIRPEQALNWVSLSAALNHTGPRRDAFMAARRTLQLDPTNAGAFNNLGVLYSQRGRFIKAMSMFAASCRAAPTLEVPWANIGRTLVRVACFTGIATLLVVATYPLAGLAVAVAGGIVLLILVRMLPKGVAWRSVKTYQLRQRAQPRSRRR
jgi:tetratricopeptide (TPR) repeat protein